MRFLEEHRRRPAALADHLPWAALVAPGVVLNKDGSFTTGFRFRDQTYGVIFRDIQMQR